MPLRLSKTSAVLCLWALAACSLCLIQTAAHGQAKTPRAYIGTVPDTGQFLSDTTVLARVEDKVIRVRDFVEIYYSAYAEYVPRPDSAGRVQFLQNLIDKEVLAKVAREAGRSENFEDRVVMREHTERVLGNVLFQRAVYDSVPLPDEAELIHVQRQMARQRHLQQIVCARREVAERARAELTGRKLSWKEAVKRFSIVPPDTLPEGDRGWLSRGDLDPRAAVIVFDLAPGSLSPVITETIGYSIYRVVRERAGQLPPLAAFRNVLGDQIRTARIAEHGERFLAVLGAKAGMKHDTANLVWTASRFSRPYRVVSEGRPVLEIDTSVPSFAPEDTARVLAVFDRGRVTLGTLVRVYEAMQPLTRPSLTTFEAVRHQVEVIALEPRLAEIARERGLDRDSLAVALIQTRREQLMVEHVYQDSIMSKVWVSAAERRKYYDDHVAQFITFPAVRYATFHAGRRGEADSLAARLRAGESALAIIRADSLAGLERGAIQERRQNENGAPHHKLLFEELKPKQVVVIPDGNHFDVIQSVEYDPGRQLSYEESQTYADESAQNLKAEELFKEFLARHRRRARIESRPELVMLIRLMPPS